MCDICGRRCHSLNALQVHQRSHNPDKQFMCEICNKSFKVRGISAVI